MKTQRSPGTTESEKYLAQLADKTFLNVWQWPNLYRDQIVNGKRTGKELCDLLVVCGDQVVIFSDKTIKWKNRRSTDVAWNSWYNKAVKNSVDQIRGAERWIRNNPHRIYLDAKCTQPFPLTLASAGKLKIHAVAVAIGAARACSDHFNGDIGSFMINPDLKGSGHTDTSDPNYTPFTIGDVNPDGTFVHVVNDVTLDILLKELDTVTDFTDYLSSKEEFVRSGHLGMSGGEEDLLAYYLTNLVDPEHHGFPSPHGGAWKSHDHLTLDTGNYAALVENPQYKRKKLADTDSYVWDALIRTFTNHMIAGTTLVPDGKTFSLKDHERGVRYMAQEPRLKRRLLGAAILDVLGKAHLQTRTFKGLMIPPPDRCSEVAYAFLTLKHPKEPLAGGYDQYRRVRSNFLITYCMALLRRHPNVKTIVGIACEPLPSKGESPTSSEDMVLVEQPEWTPEMICDLEADCKDLGVMTEGVYSQTFSNVIEYPDEMPQPNILYNRIGHGNRQYRRAQAAKKRRGYF